MVEYLCPACNGLTNLSESCINCGSVMSDGGRVDYYDTPYSPYFPDLSNLAAEHSSEQHDRCIHLLSCPECGWDKKVPVAKCSV